MKLQVSLAVDTLQDINDKYSPQLRQLATRAKSLRRQLKTIHSQARRIRASRAKEIAALQQKTL